MSKYLYIATVGRKYKIEPFEGFVSLRKDHLEVLEGKVSYDTPTTLIIETTLNYDVGQKVSIGGFPMGGKMFLLDELSITNNPVLQGAEIIEKEKVK